ncbi:hypothetical protein N0V94_003022 [Neodidymelliopsis sp. IMI 364377]|nr:hypothetical protein N0V94_003022 [Neodidymelliopsis sp. IMI 364377]
MEQPYAGDDRFAPPSSAQIESSSRHVAKSPTPVSSTTVAPAQRTFFDPWNSSSTGHQRAENRLSGSTSWRVSRNLKLSEQYKGGLTGGKRVADTVGAGSENFAKDGRKDNGGWEKGAQGLRTNGQQSLADVWAVSKAAKRTTSKQEALQAVDSLDQRLDIEPNLHGSVLESTSKPREKKLFEGLCFYVNGSTAPLVSDHKLKHLLATHGAQQSIALGRRTVTHVILGSINANGGAGGGLAATKIQKEVSRIGGKGIKYVTVEWVLESIKESRRLPESRFAPLKLAHKNQDSVFGMLNRSSAKGGARIKPNLRPT